MVKKNEVYIGDALRVDFQLSDNGVPITGATVNILIKRLSDNKYWTGAAWQAGIPGQTMTEYDAVNYQGYYYYTLTPDSIENETILVAIWYNDGVDDLYETHVWYIRNKITLQATTGKAFSITQQTKSGLEEIFELMYSRLGGKHTFGNTGGGGEIEAKLYSYSELILRKTLSILKPNLTDNAVALDSNALSGQEE